MQTQWSHVHRHGLRTASAGLGLFLTVLGLAVFYRLASPAGEPATLINPPLKDIQQPAGSGTERAVFAGGCFWGVQAVFQHTKGVTSAVSGYAGGTPAAPSYEQVSSGRTGHAESVEITFDPQHISFGRLLQIYFSVAHDPTQLNRQDPDEGTQYRSEIFATSDTQQRAVEAYIAELDKAHAFARPIVTRVEQLKAFYPAEPYHQDYATLHPGSLYIAVYDLPKIANLKKLYPELYREQPVLVGAAPGPLPSAILGVATGLLWAPCAGPILGLILTGATLNGASAWTSLLLLAYALGAAPIDDDRRLPSASTGHRR